MYMSINTLIMASRNAKNENKRDTNERERWVVGFHCRMFLC
jgi:hypothetical protein